MLCSAQVIPVAAPNVPQTVDDAVLGAQLYRIFVGTGEGALVVEPEGRVLIYQRLELPVDGREWRILAATPRAGVNLNPGRVEGYVTVKADYRDGANRGFHVDVRPWEDGGKTVHAYFSLTVGEEKGATLNDGTTIIPVIGVQSRSFTGDQLDAILAAMEQLAANDPDDLRDMWWFLLDAAALSEVLPPMNDIRCANCQFGGPGSSSCTNPGGSGVTCVSATHYACCGGSGSNVFAICCPNPP